MLARMISAEWREGEENEYFIDQNPTLFELVLDYMRNNELYEFNATTPTQHIRRVRHAAVVRSCFARGRFSKAHFACSSMASTHSCNNVMRS